MAPTQLGLDSLKLASSLTILPVEWRSRGLRSSSLSSRSINRPPERGFFGKLFLVVGSLVIFESLFSTINSLWNLIHRRHVINTALAQLELDKKHWDHHSNEWAYKNQIARGRMKVTVALLNPQVFVKEFISKEKEGSEVRKRMTALLKRVNPEYYEKVQEQLGDIGTLRDVDFLAEEEAIEDVDTYLFGPEKAAKEPV